MVPACKKKKREKEVLECPKTLKMYVFIFDHELCEGETICGCMSEGFRICECGMSAIMSFNDA